MARGLYTVNKFVNFFPPVSLILNNNNKKSRSVQWQLRAVSKNRDESVKIYKNFSSDFCHTM